MEKFESTIKETIGFELELIKEGNKFDAVVSYQFSVYN